MGEKNLGVKETAGVVVQAPLGKGFEKRPE